VKGRGQALPPGRIASPTRKADSQLPAPHLIPHPSYFILSLPSLFPSHLAVPKSTPLLILHTSSRILYFSARSPLDCFANARNDDSPDDSPAFPLSLTSQPAHRDESPATHPKPLLIAHSSTRTLPQPPRSSQIDTIAHSSLLTAHSLISPLAMTVRCYRYAAAERMGNPLAGGKFS
jgi:hypothetical protein